MLRDYRALLHENTTTIMRLCTINDAAAQETALPDRDSRADRLSLEDFLLFPLHELAHRGDFIVT